MQSKEGGLVQVKENSKTWSTRYIQTGVKTCLTFTNTLVGHHPVVGLYGHRIVMLLTLQGVQKCKIEDRKVRNRLF